MIGLATAGLHQIKKVYDVNYKLEEHFKDFIEISKVLKLKSKYKLYTKVRVVGVDPTPPDIPAEHILFLGSRYKLKEGISVYKESEGVDYSLLLESKYILKDKIGVYSDKIPLNYNLDISLGKRFSLYTEALTGAFKSLSISLKDKYELYDVLNVLSDIEVVNTLSIYDKYKLRDNLEVLRGAYYSLYKEVRYLLSSNLEVVRSSAYMYDLISKYKLEDKLSILKSSGYDLEALTMYLLKDISKIGKIIGELNRDADAVYSLRSNASFVLTRGYALSLEDKYRLKDSLSIVVSTVEDEEDDELVERIVLKDEVVDVVIKSREYISIEDAFVGVDDGIVKVGSSGTVEVDAEDYLYVLSDEVVDVKVKDRIVVKVEDAFINLEDEVDG